MSNRGTSGFHTGEFKRGISSIAFSRNFIDSGSSIPVPPAPTPSGAWQNRAIGWSEDASISAAELAAGNEYTRSGGGDFIIPTSPSSITDGDGRLFIAQDEAADDLTSVLLPGGHFNQLAAFTKSGSTVDSGGVTYEIWVSNQNLDISHLQNMVLTISP